MTFEDAMRISRRTSGGRGEYEISEISAEGLMPHDIVDRRIILDLGEMIVLDTATHLRHAQGEFRIRRVHPDGDIQLHRQVVAALLLPEAIRANEPMGGGDPIIQKGRYAIEAIQIGRVRPADGRVVLCIEGVIIANRDHPPEELHVADRASALVRL